MSVHKEIKQQIDNIYQDIEKQYSDQVVPDLMHMKLWYLSCMYQIYGSIYCCIFRKDLISETVLFRTLFEYYMNFIYLCEENEKALEDIHQRIADQEKKFLGENEEDLLDLSLVTPEQIEWLEKQNFKGLTFLKLIQKVAFKDHVFKIHDENDNDKKIYSLFYRAFSKVVHANATPEWWKNQDGFFIEFHAPTIILHSLIKIIGENEKAVALGEKIKELIDTNEGFKKQQANRESRDHHSR
jgi:hypothetical protein